MGPIARSVERNILSQGQTWVIGGYDQQKDENTNAIWVSKDGIKFSKIAINPKETMFLPKHAPACLYLASRNSILIVDGKGGIKAQNSAAWVINESHCLKLLRSF